MILIDYLVKLADKYNPLSLVTLLAIRLDKKVRPKGLVSQQLISGALSYLVVFSPILLILWFLLSLAEYAWFFDVLLLWIATSFSMQKAHYKKIQEALAAQKHMLARQWLSLLVKRETQQLSPIGICKAAIESILLRFNYQMLTPIFLYLLSGPILALAYRIALQCYWQWKRPFSQQAWFGKPVNLFCKLCQLFPMCVMITAAFLFLLPRKTTNENRPSVQLANTPAKLSKLQSVLFNLVGKRLGFCLGGPMKYDGETYRLGRYGAPLQVRFSDMSAINYSITSFSLIFFALFALVSIFSQLSLSV